RFHTPKKVPGNNMKKSPVVTKAISKRDRASSRARVKANISAGQGPGGLGFDAVVAISARELAIPLLQTTASSKAAARGKRMLFWRGAWGWRSFSTSSSL